MLFCSYVTYGKLNWERNSGDLAPDEARWFSSHPRTISSQIRGQTLRPLTRLQNEASARRPRRVEAQLLGRRGRRCVEELERLSADVHRRGETGGSRRARRCAALWCCRVLCCGADAWRRDIGIQCARRRNVCVSEEKQKVLVVARSPVYPSHVGTNWLAYPMSQKNWQSPW